MAKKKRVEISKDPLSPTTIGELKKHSFGWIFLLFAFIFFIGAIYYLPEIYDLKEKEGQLNFDSIVQLISNSFDSFFNGGSSSNSTTNTTVEKSFDYLMIENDKEGNLGDIKYFNLIKEDDKVKLSVSNIDTTSIDFISTPYYFNFYDENGNMIKRYIIPEKLEAGTSRDLIVDELLDAKYYEFKRIENDNYPQVELKEDEEGNKVLTCPQKDTTLVYTFDSNKLVKIKEFGKYSSSHSEYETKLSYYNNLMSSTNEAISVELNTLEEEFDFVFQIDYTKGDVSFSNPNYFIKDTSADKINFIMEANSTICR